MESFEPFEAFDMSHQCDFDIGFKDDSPTNEVLPVTETKEPEYDMATKEKYRVLRNIKQDPITYYQLNDVNAFKFEFKWDPYTGIRQESDKDGSLYFDPDVLIKHFYTKRLDKLWIEPSDESQGYFQGHYDYGVGLGDDFDLIGRGQHPEWYLFRLPIIDCYLTKDHNKQFITFGPRLTDEEIKEIDDLAALRPDNYLKLFGANRPSLVAMKKLYDNAISKTPTFFQETPKCITQESFDQENRSCVDLLRKLKG